MTSAELNKQLKKLQNERTTLLLLEETSALFTAATIEKMEEVRPAYNLIETNSSLADIERQIREIKHRLNLFNTTYVVEELGMTIDEVLVFLPQQKARVDKLEKFAKHAPKLRTVDRYGVNRGNLIEYEYTNFRTDEALRLYEKEYQALVHAQLSLDKANSTVDVP